MKLDDIEKLCEGGGHERLACHNPEVIDKLLKVARDVERFIKKAEMGPDMGMAEDEYDALMASFAELEAES